MIADQDILCFANDWDSDPLSKKHVMTRLARHNRVLWVDSLGLRNPRVSARDAGRAWGKLRRWMRGARRVDDNIHVYSPVVIPFHAIPAVRRINRLLLRAMLRRQCRRLGFRDPITWSFVPTSADVVGRLGEKLVVYHCVDDYAEFDGADRRTVLEMENDLVRRADAVIVSSGPLLEAKRRINPSIRLVTHGVDVDHFQRSCWPETGVAAELEDLPRPVIGFFGLIAEWVDLELVRAMATTHPEWSIVLVGKADVDTSTLRALPNVHLTGRVPYERLPAYCKRFDVATIPFVVNDLTLAANPLKMREYLAAGLPVVSTPLPEAERLAAGSGFIRIGLDPEHFVEQVDRFLDEGCAGPQYRISRTMEGESWDGKVRDMCRFVDGRLEAGAGAVEDRHRTRPVVPEPQ